LKISRPGERIDWSSLVDADVPNADLPDVGL
jgi:hypothetical protein